MAVPFHSADVRRAALRPATPTPELSPLRSPRLLDQPRARVRLPHYSRRTELAYAHWCRALMNMAEAEGQ